MSAPDLQVKIREAYDSVARKTQDWVPLRTLRPLIKAEQADFDKALIALIRAEAAVLAPDSNRKALTDADRSAAIRVGGEDKHLLAFQADYDY